MKKITSLFLVLVMLTSFCTAFAASDVSDVSNAQKEHADVLYLQEDGKGLYSVSTKSSENIIAGSGNIIVAKATEDAEIYHISDEKYVTNVYDDTYFLVDKIDVDTEEFSANDAVFEEYQISDNIISDIEQKIAQQKAFGNDKFAVSIFAPSILEESTPNEGTYTTQSTTTVGPVYPYGGYSFRDTLIKYTGFSSDMVKKEGVDAWAIAKSFYDLTITVAGAVFDQVAAFTVYGLAASALDVYEAFVGPVSFGSYGDKIHTMVWYDYIDKITEINYMGSWRIGCRTGKVWLNNQETFQSYAAYAQTWTTRQILNREIFSDNYKYDNPAKKAIQWVNNYGWVDGDIRIKIHSTNWILWA